MMVKPHVKPMSPIPDDIPTRLLNFYEALERAALGDRIHKKAWNDENIYCLMHEGRLKIRTQDDQLHDWIITEGDFVGEDWIIL